MSHRKWSSQIVVPSVFIIYYIRSGSNHQKMTRFNPPSAAQKCQDSLYQGLQVLWLSDIRTGSLQKSNMAWKIISKTSKKPFSAGISHHVPSMFDDTEMPKCRNGSSWGPRKIPIRSSRLRIPKRRGPTHRFGVAKVILQPGVVTAMWPSTEMKLTWKWSENSTVMGYIYIYIDNGIFMEYSWDIMDNNG